MPIIILNIVTVIANVMVGIITKHSSSKMRKSQRHWICLVTFWQVILPWYPGVPPFLTRTGRMWAGAQQRAAGSPETPPSCMPHASPLCGLILGYLGLWKEVSIFYLSTNVSSKNGESPRVSMISPLSEFTDGGLLTLMSKNEEWD